MDLHRVKTSLAAALLLLAASPCWSVEADLKRLVDLANKSLRGDSSHGRMTMTIVTPNWKRAMEVEGWNLEREYAYILIHSPPKEKDNATLRRRNEMWLWLSRVERVVKIPSTMMQSSWQGSDFTYDDIVKADSVVRDYEHKLLEQREEPVDAETARSLGLKEPKRKVFVIEGKPLPTAPVVWGRILMTVAAYGEGDFEVVPLREEDYSERGELIRTILLSDIKRLSGRILPTKMECQPAKKPGQKTSVRYHTLEFDIPLKDSFFSLKRLEKKRT